MRDNNIKLHAGLDESRTGKFNYLRIVEQTGRVAIQFPDKATEFAEFKRGDVLEFDAEQSSFIARSLEPEGSAPVEFWVQTMSGIRARSALLVGEVTITGVEQDSNDEPLFVRTNRGLDLVGMGDKVLNAAGGFNGNAAPIPGSIVLRDIGWGVVQDHTKYNYLNITNNAMLPQGGGQQFIDRRIALLQNFASPKPFMWIEEGETVRIPTVSVLAFGGLVQSADYNNLAQSYVTWVGELK